MKLKLKHLRAVLTKAKISTQTCKDKRDLAELILRNRNRLYTKPMAASSSTNSSSSQAPNVNARASSASSVNNRRNSNHSNGGNQQQANSSGSNPFSSFMNNVQDFVNYNLNSVLNNSVPCPPPPTRPASNNNNYYANINNVHNNNNSNHSSTSSSTHSANSIPNLNSVFNMFGEQFSNSFAPNATASSYPGTDASTTGAPGFPFNNNTSPFVNTTYSNRNSESNTSSADEVPTSTAAPSNSGATTATTGSTATKRRASLSDLKCEQDIDNLTIRQIKEILASNFVDYKGCCERRELVDKLRRLYTSDRENKKLEERLNNPTTTTTSSENAGTSSSTTPHAQPPPSNLESELCKICMESVIDCVLLDCGHMCSCIKCGKQLAECPICRQNVVRVVRVFKS